MATITDLAEQVSGQVTDADLLLTHQPTGASYTGKSVKRSAFLHDVVRTGGNADLNRLVVTEGISAESVEGVRAEFSSFIQIGSKLEKLLLSSNVTEAVSAAAGASDTITVPLSEALTGDFVIVHTTGLDPGVFASGVAGSGSVAVTIFNATASPFAETVTVKILAIRAAAGD